MLMMNGKAKRSVSLFLVLLLIVSTVPALASQPAATFEEALFALKTPAQLGAESGEYAIHTGDSAYLPSLDREIIPFDMVIDIAYAPLSGEVESSDESVVTVADDGKMTAHAQGMATVTYHKSGGDEVYEITVSDDVPTELAKNYIYVLRNEFYTVQRSRLPKWNKYAKWYYNKKNEVGWCSVFTIYCANAAGANPIKQKTMDLDNIPATQFFAEGQVGSQYDGFMKMGRFSNVPKPGFLVIYADMKKAYRTTHIGSVVDVADMGDGLYAVTTIEGNMSSSVKSYCYLYDSNNQNYLVGSEGADKKLKLQNNMQELPKEDQVDPLVQYELHTDYWSVFGFCETWK
ncbi:MAG: hypothetical protein GX096_13460 [Clostridiales bacterium]|nr:hypothetical protein [Clostridiales bacterium]